MNREVFVEDLKGAHVFNAIETQLDLWLWTEYDMSGMCRGQWEALISWIDSKIRNLEFATVTIDYEKRHTSQYSRNIWVDGEYLVPAQWLVKLIPHEDPKKGICKDATCGHDGMHPHYVVKYEPPKRPYGSSAKPSE
jgi:hypothetical protein